MNDGGFPEEECFAFLGVSGGSVHSSGSEQKVTLVFFLGGVTFAEISALRFLSQMEDGLFSEIDFLYFIEHDTRYFLNNKLHSVSFFLVTINV